MLYFFKISCFFSKPLLDASVSCHDYARFDLKNSIIAIELYIVLVLNLYFCGGCALKSNYYNLNLSDERFRKW